MRAPTHRVARSVIVAAMTRSLLYLQTKPGRREEVLQIFERLGILAVAAATSLGTGARAARRIRSSYSPSQ